MLNSANAFYLAFRRCLAEVALSPNVFQSPQAPAVVCGALSIEIYLKLLLKLAALDVPHTHDLVELFNMLPSGTRRSVLDVFENGAEQFKQLLDEIRNYFLDYRYEYEYSGGPRIMIVGAFEQIIGALHNTVLAIDPWLSVHGENASIRALGERPRARGLES